jgi:hypothetical protein
MPLPKKGMIFAIKDIAVDASFHWQPEGLNGFEPIGRSWPKIAKSDRLLGKKSGFRKCRIRHVDH